MWFYKTEVGTFNIRKQFDGCWGLWLDDGMLGSYLSPEAAADDVYTQSTGCYEWDSLQSVTEPMDLLDWEESEQL